VEFPKDMSQAAVSIVKQLLMKNPALRIWSNGSDDTVWQDSFFIGIDWHALQEKRVKPPEKETVAEHPEEYNQSFSKVLKFDNTPGIIN